MKGIKTVPAQSANFQPKAPFHPAPRTLLFDVWFTTTEFMLRSKKCEGAWIPSNPLGLNGFQQRSAVLSQQYSFFGQTMIRCF